MSGSKTASGAAITIMCAAREHRSRIERPARWPISRRIGVGPEIVHIAGDRLAHLVLTGNLTFDVPGPVDSRSRPVNAFLVAGGGLCQTREDFDS